jgi:hypothetical protein
MTPDTDLDRLVRAADPAAGRPAPPVDTSPLALAAVRAGLTDQPAAPPVRAGLTSRSPARGWLPVAASVAAVVAVVGLAAAVGGAGPDFGLRPGSAELTTVPSGGDSKPSPGEQKPSRGEHTASAGPEYDRAKRLLAALQGAVPAGYTVPDGGLGPGEDYGPTSGPGSTLPTIGPDGSGMPAAYFQAVRYEGPYEGYQGYEYFADTIASKGSDVGSLGVRVWKRVPAWSQDPCVVLQRIYWNTGVSCRVVGTPGGERVAVVDAEVRGMDRREGQWAGYRRSDGTVVLVTQGPGVLNVRISALDRPVFSAEALAALAADDRFPAAVA